MRGAIHLLLLLAAVGLIAFFAISSTFNFQDKVFQALFGKKSSFAAGESIGFVDNLGNVITSTSSAQVKVKLIPPVLPTSTPAPSWNSTDGLQGYWSLDETEGNSASDKSGNGGSGTFKGTGNHWDSGKISGAANFNGIDDSITIPSSPSLNFGTKSFSYGLWVYLNSATTVSTWQLPLWKGGSNAKLAGYDIEYNQVKNYLGAYISDGVSIIGSSAAKNLKDESWHHIFVTVDRENSLLTLFLDGFKLSQRAIPAGFGSVDNSQQLLISKAPSYPVLGKMDEVRIYNYALSANQVIAVMNNQNTIVPLESGLMTYHKFDESSGAMVSDSSGNSFAGTWFGAGNHWGEGKFNGGGQFNGANDYVNIPLYKDIDRGSFSYGLWVNFDLIGTTLSSWQLPLWKGGSSTVAGFDIEYNQIIKNLGAYISDGNKANYTSLYFKKDLLDGNWHHIFVTVDRMNSLFTLYMDGVKVSQRTIPQSFGSISNSFPIYISKSPNYLLKGKVDEFRLYNYSLTPEQVNNVFQGKSASSIQIKYTGVTLSEDPNFPSNSTVTRTFPFVEGEWKVDWAFKDNTPGTKKLYGKFNLSDGTTTDAVPFPASILLQAPEGSYDLDVTFIERIPRYNRYKLYEPYPDGYPRLIAGTENEQKWPNPGDQVTFTGHIKNKGIDKTGFEYKWYIDGVEAASGTSLPIGAGEESVATYQWVWQSGDHTVKFVADPDNSVSELSKANNKLEDKTNTLSLRFHVEKSVYDSFNSLTNTIGTKSFEDWAQFQIQTMNNYITQSGGKEKIRLDQIVVENDGVLPRGGTHAPLDWEWDGRWGFEKNEWIDSNPSSISYWVTKVQGGLIHELSHQIGLIDNYHLFYDYNNIKTNYAIPWCRNFTGGPAPGTIYEHCQYYDQTFISGVMTNSSATTYGSEDVGALNSNLGFRRGFFGEYLYDIPDQNTFEFEDPAGNPLANSPVSFYQSNGCLGNRSIPEAAVFSGNTDQNGSYTLPNRAVEDFTTVTGHTLKDNPFGKIEVVGCNGIFLMKLPVDSQTYYAYTNISYFNNAYWSGNKTSATYTIKTKVLPSEGVTTPTPTPNTTLPLKPSVSVPSCSNTPYSVTISWTNQGNPVAIVDISTTSGFSTYYNKGVSSTATSTTAPDGFKGYQGVIGTLILDPGVTYYTRTFNYTGHSPVSDPFNVPTCPTPSPTPNSTPSTSYKRVFVTSGDFNQSLGSLGANQLCSSSAINARIGGTWSAWISKTIGGADVRVNHASVPYKLVDGITVVANNWDDLVDGSLINPISKDEFGNSTNAVVWTGTVTNGTLAVGNNCNDWTNSSNNFTGLTGKSTEITSSWTEATTDSCDLSSRKLYCFEQ